MSARPALADGKVFFVAGYWPTEGIFVHALDTRIGEVIWMNDTSRFRPFGEMRVTAGTLFVSGHHGFGAYDAETGEAASEKPPRLQAPAAPAVPPGVEGTVARSFAAEGRLFVSTVQGRIYCFGEKETEPRVHEERPVEPEGDFGLADKVLAASDVTEGYCLVPGLRDGRLVEGLLRRSKLNVIAIDPDEEKVDSIRRRLDGLGLFDDHRLAILAGEPETFGLPPYVASLAVSEKGSPLTDAMRRALRPYGGTFARRSWGRWRLTRREGSLPGAADWTHEFADEGNSLAANDTLARAPLGFLWYGGRAADVRYYFNGKVDHQSGEGVSPLPPNAEVVDGRMILQGPGILAAADIYTGRLLWETPIPRMFVFGGRGGGVGIHSKRYREPWKVPEALKMDIPPSHHCRTSGLNYVSVSDGIYVAAGRRLLRYGPADGRLLSDWRVPLGEGLCWGNIRISGEHLVATAFRPKDIVDAEPGHDGNGGDWVKDRMRMSHLVVLDRRSGRLLWSREAAWGFLNQGTAAGGGKVFCVDLIVEGGLAKLREAGHAFPDAPPTLYALDIETGREAWRFVTDVLVKQLTYSKQRDILVAPCRNLIEWKDGRWRDPRAEARRGKRDRNAPGRMRGFRGADGKLLWEVAEAPYFEPHIIVHDLVSARIAGSIPLRRAGFNLGAPGDRPAADGTLWLAVGPRRDINVVVQPTVRPVAQPVVQRNDVEWFRFHPSRFGSWIASSGVTGVARITIPAELCFSRKRRVSKLEPRTYGVRLFFAEPEDRLPGERVFTVRLVAGSGGRPVLTDLDVVKEAGGPRREVVKELKGVRVEKELVIEFDPKAGEPVLCGVRLEAE